MKRSLLFTIIALLISSAGAQLKSSKPLCKPISAQEKASMVPLQAKQQKLDFSKITTTKKLKAHKYGKPDYSNNMPRKAKHLEPFYKRPAGMYVSPFIAYNGVGLWSLGGYVFLMAKPFADYTWHGEVSGEVDENTNVSWDYFIRDEVYYIDDIYDISYSSYWWLDPCPIFYAVDGDNWENSTMYQIKAYDTEENSSGGVTINGETPAFILSTDNDKTVSYMFGQEGIDFMYSSKTMIPGGRNADKVDIFTRCDDAIPWDDNDYGWWFGKNASHVDGMAQAFEKPQHPYLLKNVYLQCDPDVMVVKAPVKMECRVYKLNEIPDYQEHGGVVLPVEPGEHIATGEATVTPTTGEALNGLITFTLIGHDEDDPSLTYEYHPTIDYPIMICIDGYNDPGMEDLVDFCAFVSADDQVDEGYGELAYLKQGIFETKLNENGDTLYDEVGNPVEFFTGEYYWRGVNNYFGDSTMTMMTGISIFIGTENPYLTFVHSLEDGEFLFPDEGGLMSKTFEYSDGSVYTTESIDFFSSFPSEDGEMWMTCNGSEEIPDWLEIHLLDNNDEMDEFWIYVTAQVTAEPLPAGVNYREAIIRFNIPGDFVDYKFMQGDNTSYTELGDVNMDGFINISDVVDIIDYLLGSEVSNFKLENADLDGDGRVTISDVTELIDILLNSNN